MRLAPAVLVIAVLALASGCRRGPVQRGERTDNAPEAPMASPPRAAKVQQDRQPDAAPPKGRAAPTLAEEMDGGYVERKVTDEDVVAAARFALETAKGMKSADGRIVRAASQVVAGTNYRLDLEVIDRSGDHAVRRQAQAVVYQGFDDKYELTSWEWNKTE